ncbi:preprotein translocase subunit YajC [Streptomyces polyrhachis]|uniref:Preprotein translocase subunit YajC n=1 Tax=Streptomyces polyrhachis TaxID=1282885 RepID=A0ABW2GCQ3_9ACTN
MDIGILLPFIILIGAMLLMTRSAKNKQRQAAQMRDSMQPGSGVRTIGGMYAVVKEVHDDAVLLEVAPGVHAVYAKNSIGAILDDEEYNRIVHGVETAKADDLPEVPEDASSLTGGDAGAREGDSAPEAPEIDLGKPKDAADGDDQDGSTAK